MQWKFKKPYQKYQNKLLLILIQLILITIIFNFENCSGLQAFNYKPLQYDKNKHEVIFRSYFPDYVTPYLIGTFTDFEKKPIKMKKTEKNNIWETRVRLEAGGYLYCYYNKKNKEFINDILNYGYSPYKENLVNTIIINRQGEIEYYNNINIFSDVKKYTKGSLTIIYHPKIINEIKIKKITEKAYTYLLNLIGAYQFPLKRQIYIRFLPSEFLNQGSNWAYTTFISINQTPHLEVRIPLQSVKDLDESNNNFYVRILTNEIFKAYFISLYIGWMEQSNLLDIHDIEKLAECLNKKQYYFFPWLVEGFALNNDSYSWDKNNDSLSKNHHSWALLALKKNRFHKIEDYFSMNLDDYAKIDNFLQDYTLPIGSFFRFLIEEFDKKRVMYWAFESINSGFERSFKKVYNISIEEAEKKWIAKLKMQDNVLKEEVDRLSEIYDNKKYLLGLKPIFINNRCFFWKSENNNNKCNLRVGNEILKINNQKAGFFFKWINIWLKSNVDEDIKLEISTPIYRVCKYKP